MSPRGWKHGASGRLGEADVYLGDLLAAALLAQVDGSLRLETAAGEAHVFFQRGAPVHVSGTAVLHDFLGQLLVARGAVAHEVVESAYASQDLEARSNTTARRPLGAILVSDAGVSPDDITSAVRDQIGRRLTHLMTIDAATWTMTSGGVDAVAPIAVPVDGWAVLGHMLREHAQDAELAALSDALLGHAVRLTAAPDTLMALRPTPEEQELLRLLERPRKTHHLELATAGRRRARTLLKTLDLLGVLERLPAAQGVPIKEAVKNVAAPSVSVSVPPREPSGVAEASSPGSGGSAAPAAAAPVAPPRALTPPPVSRKDSPMVAELRQVQARVGKVSYYDLLGVKTNAPAGDIRAAYTAAAKKFHPDAFGSDAGPDVEGVARVVAAALNDAYTTLSDPEKRGKYDQGLKVGHVVVDEQSGSRALGAKTKYEMSVVHLRRHDYAKARETLKMAMEMHPQNGLYKGAYGWTFFADPTQERAEAVLKAAKLLEEGLALSPKEAALHYYLGCVLKERGDTAEAAQCFKRALQLEPKHKDAASELRLLSSRKKAEREKEKSAGSVLSRLLKR
jgi:curved DNA-binding protein CbpA